MKGPQVLRSEQFMYFQNKAYHYENLRKIRATIDTTAKSYKHEVDKDGFIHDGKYRRSLQQKNERENQKMMDRIIGIINSPRTQIAVQGGYSKLNQFKKDFMKIKKDQIEKQLDLKKNNTIFAEKIINSRPKVGNRKVWSERYDRNLQDLRIMKKFRDSQRKSQLEFHQSPHLLSSIASILKPQELNTMKQNKKVRLNYSRLFQLPQLYSTRSRHSISNTVDLDRENQ